MTYRILIIITMLLTFSSLAAAESTLVKIAKADGKDTTQVFFSFDQLPPYSHKVSNKRIDILLENTLISPEAEIFGADDRIIRIVPSGREEMTVISFFFRYQPQKVKVETADDGKLVLEVLLGNRYSRSYQDLSERLKGLTVVEEETIDYSNPLLTSPYAHDWRSFIRNYEAPLSIDVAIDFTLPPFPLMALIPPNTTANIDLLPEDLTASVAVGDYGLLAQQLYALLQVTPGVETQKLLALTYGEALLRNNDFTGAYKQLYLLWQEYPKEHVGLIARYLLVVAEARYQDPYLAHYNFKEFEQSVPASHPLAPYLVISRAEAALATRQYEEARVQLDRDDIAFPQPVQRLRQLRQGDYYSGTGQLVKAYVTYTLLDDTDLLQRHPYSLNSYCSTIYRQKKYRQAATCYQTLAPQISEPEPLSKIAYRTAMSELRSTTGPELIAAFARVEDAFPGTEAGSLAAIKQTDLKLLSNPSWTRQAVQLYGQIAAQSVKRSTVAEASLKEAIIASLLGEQRRSIDLLMGLLRNLQASDIRDSAQALLLALLPGEIESRIAKGDYMDALVLAKQNRDMFQNNWLPLDLMASIARAYQQVGIHDEAQRVYIYLLEMSDIDTREKYFLPLIQSVYDRGDYGLVEDYGSQYSYNYPDGKDTEPVLILRLRGLVASSRYADAKELLPVPLPENTEIRLLAAEIFFHGGDFTQAREVLTELQAAGYALDTTSRFYLAESMFQLDDYPGAQPIFSELAKDELHGQQSLYRLAQIARSQGEEANALKIFEKIVEKEEDGLWKRYAERELEYARLRQSIDKMIDG